MRRTKSILGSRQAGRYWPTTPSCRRGSRTGVTRTVTPMKCVTLRPAPPRLQLLLRLELRVVRLEERPDLVGHVEQLDPLLLVERHGKPTKSVDGQAALLADLERHPSRDTLFQGGVLFAQSLELCFEFVVGHLDLLRGNGRCRQRRAVPIATYAAWSTRF